MKTLEKERWKGIAIGALLPVVALLITAYVDIKFFYPTTTNEFFVATLQRSYSGLLTDYLMSTSKFHAFFCISVNMPLVWVLTNRKKDIMAKGLIVPTAIYALVLVILRLVV